MSVLQLTHAARPLLFQYPVMFSGTKAADDAVTKLKEALQWLEGFFGNNKFVAGASRTVADFAIASTMATLEVGEAGVGADRIAADA